MAKPVQAVARRGETYGGRSRREREADRRERIVTAAVRLFAAREYDAVTVAEVCAQAKVAKRYFYDYFTDRQELLRQVHREQNDWLLNEITTAAPKNPATLTDLLAPMMTTLVRRLLDHPDRARVIYLNAPRMESRRRATLRRDAELLGRLVRRIADRPPDRLRHDRLLLAAVAGISEIVIDWLTRGQTDPPDPLAEHLTDLTVAILSP
ncbi:MULTISPECIES: TetR/AcrR family transcriptional regulator [unclassified Crossiella]|uniref:TetR/AcrR family transcriptional regulator n=1 Tax=unclassified Crossiella TaxID=2620835 RepID=UPI001FFE5520|nr:MULTISPECIES: TetR/AcrR family transcriptional regulator [unclassified Crossiella]MCK2238992.1 TetR/AcrR family transcriptional regulator [Crossiella sp. S99.2]MCK2251439.1 TetR/AcrR family transcriptional regulator [Crossiella sp. S99.1]